MIWFVLVALWAVLVVGIIVLFMGAHRGQLRSGERPTDLYWNGRWVDGEQARAGWLSMSRRIP